MLDNNIQRGYKHKQTTKENKMTKGEILISSVAGKTFITENLLMENKDFVMEAKKLIKDGCYTMDQLVTKLVNWCENNC
jgi:anti-sigma28 factor (negative regulator of flagellin synthesis)